ncbi:hypothetical protein ARMGADRAFT_1013409 [Armillaria gallica]|uniref:Uncharacterized protein n=1 Tax=Armillaria gallica TaxID=47427 RepID=A0A2H3DA96_ARMGA|nr:hypothetical protein ARMGADRAFT_1013409 [Armillaria gallica]
MCRRSDEMPQHFEASFFQSENVSVSTAKQSSSTSTMRELKEILSYSEFGLLTIHQGPFRVHRSLLHDIDLYRRLSSSLVVTCSNLLNLQYSLNKHRIQSHKSPAFAFSITSTFSGYCDTFKCRTRLIYDPFRAKSGASTLLVKYAISGSTLDNCFGPGSK